MRVGDFAVDVVAHGGGRLDERESGHVLARPGQVYRLRLRNFGPLYCVVQLDVDGRCVTAGGLVLEPWGTTELERPINAGEDGRFTVVAEGNESVFGPDGGRDNPALGLIEARFRRELPRTARHHDAPVLSFPDRPLPPSGRDVPRPPSRYPYSPPIPSAYRTLDAPSPSYNEHVDDAIERAAGTGLTGHSDQQFVPISLGPLESEATVIRLRLVIGTEAALADIDAPATVERIAPPRPAPRP
ncbi:MAG: hypothetical protein ACM3SX_11275 [Deltaproteobacteria bacterium]